MELRLQAYYNQEQQPTDQLAYSDTRGSADYANAYKEGKGPNGCTPCRNIGMELFVNHVDEAILMHSKHDEPNLLILPISAFLWQRVLIVQCCSHCLM